MVLTTSKPPTPSDLSELAALTGYEDNPATTNGATAVTTPVIEGDASEAGPETDAALLDPEDLQVDDATPHRLWNSPWSKLIFVGLFLGIGTFAVGLLMFGFQSKWKNREEPTTAAQVQPPDPKPDAQFAPPSEAGDLKTKEALSRQATALDQTTASVSAAPGTVTPGTVKPGTNASHQTPGANPRSSAVSGPIQYSAPTASRPISSYSAPTAYRSAPQYSSPVVRPAPAYSARPAFSSSSNGPRLDPHEQWQTASTLGSYGEVSYSLPPSNASTSSPSFSSPVQTTASAAPATKFSPASSAATSEQSSDYQKSLYAADEAAILSGSPSSVTTITPGTTAAATLSTPIVWDQDLAQNQQPQRFGIQLTQPLLAADGSEALPAGSQMIAQVDTVSGSGLVQLSVQAVIEPSASGNRLVNVPAGAISIQGKGGNPLLAQNYHHNGSGLGGLNRQVAIIGALGKVGELLNRPSNSSTVSSPYISSTSVSNGNTNILGGLLEGGFGALQRQVTEQDQQEVKDILKRPNVWYVSAGQVLQVFANSSFEVAP